MKQIKCSKYHHFGNSFIIIDETQGIVINEENKNNFAKEVLNPHTGIGADGLISISTPRVLQINNIAEPHLPADDSHYIFRHFEPNGSESLMCLNGVLVTSLFLSQISENRVFNILTATNSSAPQLIRAGMDDKQNAFAEYTETTHVDETLVKPDIKEPFLPGIDKITALKIRLRKDDIAYMNWSDDHIPISGYLTFSGEPHLVIFTDTMSDDGFFTDIFFAPHLLNKRSSSGERLIQAIGMRIQKDYKHFFPKGLNLTFTQIVNTPNTSESIIRYRCFERAIDKETLSCGTAALACSSVAMALNLVKTERFTVYPYLFGKYKAGSFYLIDHQAHGPHHWKITGHPHQISSDLYTTQSPGL